MTALTATVVDFSTLYALVEHAHLYYVTATACGALAGAITNFSLNKYWAFAAPHASAEAVHRGSRTLSALTTHSGPATQLSAQGLRYALVSAVSLALNTGLVFCFTEFGQLRYLVSKTIAAIVVGWGWNYPLHRYFVFPPSQGHHE